MEKDGIESTAPAERPLKLLPRLEKSAETVDFPVATTELEGRNELLQALDQLLESFQASLQRLGGCHFGLVMPWRIHGNEEGKAQADSIHGCFGEEFVRSTGRVLGITGQRIKVALSKDALGKQELCVLVAGLEDIIRQCEGLEVANLQVFNFGIEGQQSLMETVRKTVIGNLKSFLESLGRFREVCERFSANPAAAWALMKNHAEIEGRRDGEHSRVETCLREA